MPPAAPPDPSPSPAGWWPQSPLAWGLVVALPAAVAAHFAGAAPVWVFAASGVALIPLAGLIGEATEALTARLGGGIGGFLNATFGNAAELIIALVVLSRGPEYYPIVKATITGSVIGNLLLVLGLSIVAGGVRHREQRFNAAGAGAGATLMALACTALVVPTLMYYLSGAHRSGAAARNIENLSEEIAAVLVVVYGLSLLFSLRTHKHLFNEPAGPATDDAAEDDHGPGWGVGRAVAVLLAATAGVAVLSEWLVGAIEPAAGALGMNKIFVGVIVVAIVGNAAEHFTAVLMAWRNRMDVAVGIAVGSSTQVALFVAPVLVFASLLFPHPYPLDLHFTPLEVAALALSVWVVGLVCHDGESNWLEGAMLLAVYLILALAFYHVAPAG